MKDLGGKGDGGWGRQHLQGWGDKGKDGGRGEVGKRESGTVSM